jgi:hypothetical protein
VSTSAVCLKRQGFALMFRVLQNYFERWFSVSSEESAIHWDFGACHSFPTDQTRYCPGGAPTKLKLNSAPLTE